jgi:hypothetical protein
MTSRALLLLVGLLAATACSASPEPESNESHVEAQQQHPVFPAFPYSLPQLVTKGGPILPNPTFIAITFDGDPMRDDLESFTSTLAGSSYWKTIGADYGVGAATAGTPIHVAEAASPQIDGGGIGEWLAQKLDGQNEAFGAPDASAIYVIYYPAGTSVTQGTDVSCTNFGAFHDTASVGSTSVAYAVIPRCDAYKTAADVSSGGRDFVTFAASHELLEAATDPDPGNPAYYGVDAAHELWEQVFATEVGDLCARGQRWDTPPNDVGVAVQRMWSNTAAKAGHDPCIPALSNVYFNAVPVLTESMPQDAPGASQGGGSGDSDEPNGGDAGESNAGGQATKVVTIKSGAKKTIDVKLSSDGPTSGEWTVRVMDWDNRKGTGKENLAFELDRPSGKNGDTLHLTITAKASTDGADWVPHPFVLVSTLGNQSTYWPGLVIVRDGAEGGGPGL